MFTATINRTFTSYIKAIIGAEYILRWLLGGTLMTGTNLLNRKEVHKNKLARKNLQLII